MLEFRDIKLIIKRACRATNPQSTNINDKFAFTVNAERLENGLREKSDLHVIALEPTVESFVPDVDDIQLVSEYIHKKEEYNDIFNGSTQIAFMMLYSDQEGSMRPTKIESMTVSAEEEDPQPIPDDELFKALNEEVDPELVKFIISEYPIYRIMIVRRFNWKKDKFEYSVYFRSNFNMITYIKELKSAESEEEEDDSVEEHENIEESADTNNTESEDNDDSNPEESETEQDEISVE